MPKPASLLTDRLHLWLGGILFVLALIGLSTLKLR